jgi:hypothetical protein
VCVFCGSSEGARPDYLEAARAVGALLAERGIQMVYGGGRIGLMGAAADACLAAGGRVIGVIPEALAIKEVAHAGLTELHVVATMHERKALMADLSDAFLALPGGYGTFEEFCEVVTWSQLGVHRKPCGLLNVCGFYAPLLALFDHATAEAFIRREHRRIVLVEEEPAVLLDRLAAWDSSEMESVAKWIQREER